MVGPSLVDRWTISSRSQSTSQCKKSIHHYLTLAQPHQNRVNRSLTLAKPSSPQAQKVELQVRSCPLPSLPQVIFLICAYITVYMIYVKFRKTFDSENDSFRLEFLLVPVTGLSFLENHSFTPLEVRKT